MRVMRVYADTSVFGGVFDEEFEEASRAFFQQVRAGRFVLVTSALVLEEIQPAPANVQEFFAEFAAMAEVLALTDEVILLRRAYVDAGIVSERWLADATHVALATVAGCSLIVSWNFRHIVNFQRIPLYNAVNILQGYRQIAIHSPQEVIQDEDEDV